MYSINILYFDLGKGSDYLYHGKTVFTGVHTNDLLEVNTKEAKELRMRVPQDMMSTWTTSWCRTTCLTPQKWKGVLKALC